MILRRRAPRIIFRFASVSGLVRRDLVMKTFKEFLNDLNDNDLKQRTGLDEPKSSLEAFCQDLMETIFSGMDASCYLEPGFTVNMGVEHKVIVQIVNKQFKDTLFR